MKSIRIRNMVLGEGRVKLIASLLDPRIDDLAATLEQVKASPLDAVEYRGDWSEDVHDREKMKANLRRIREILGDFPILFTFRSVNEGGKMDISVEEYIALNQALIDSGELDLVDVELRIGDENVSELCRYAHEHGVAVVCSYHNFQSTPDTAWMTALLRHMRTLGGDIPKCAVMAKDTKDLLRLLAATEEASCRDEDGPVLTMAMGKAGTLSRICGEVFGSCLSFCSLTAASAPGQIPVKDAYELAERIHKSCG